MKWNFPESLLTKAWAFCTCFSGRLAPLQAL